MPLNEAAPPVCSASFMTYEQLSRCSGMSVAELGELVGYSALRPVQRRFSQPDTQAKDHWVFSARWLKPLRAASKLRQDFDLDVFTVAVLLDQLQRIDHLEQSILGMQMKMHEMLQSGADTQVEVDRDDSAQYELFEAPKGLKSSPGC